MSRTVSNPGFSRRLRLAIDTLLNRELPPGRSLQLQVVWPLWFLPWLLLLIVFGPSRIWIALTIGLLGFYGAGYAWVRTQLLGISLDRQRQGSMLVVGDSLDEGFTLTNASPLPLLWMEFDDRSHLPGYRPGRVVSCGASTSTSWRSHAVCNQRGVFRLGPHRLRGGDPFGLFRMEIEGDQSEALLVYPRVAYLPPLQMPRGNLSGRDRRRRPLHGVERSAMVRSYRPGDSLRFIHWPTTARRGDLMVTDLEIEPSGDLWIVLDLDRAVQRGRDTTSTLEYAIVLAASAAAELLGAAERRAVGLLAASGADVDGDAGGAHSITVPPQPGQGQLWRILAALAPVQVGTLSLDRLLHHNRDLLGHGQSVLVITAALGAGASDWTAELLHLRRSGVASSALLVEAADAENGDGRAELGELLARYEIPAHFLQAGTPLQPALTYRRKKTVLRTTPTGGVVAYEVEEEVG